MSGKSGCEYMKCDYVVSDTGGVRCTHPSGVCIYNQDEKDATIAALREENRRLIKCNEISDEQLSNFMSALGEAEIQRMKIAADNDELKDANKNQMQLVSDARETLNKRNVENNTLMIHIDELILHGKSMGDEIISLREKNDKLMTERDVDHGTIMKQNGELQALRARAEAAEKERDELKGKAEKALAEAEHGGVYGVACLSCRKVIALLDPYKQILGGKP